MVVQNLRGGRIEVLGLDYEELKRRNPNVIYASLNAYGHEGPWEERPGWEQLAQGGGGMQARFASDRPYRQAFPINDYGTGLMGAYGVALALLHRQRTGEGQHVKAALAYTACTLQSPFFQDYEGKVWDEVRGHDALGWNPLQHLYRASDRWMFLGATPDLLPAIGEVEGLEGAAGLEGDALEAFLAERIAQRPAEEWTELLTALGAGAHPVRGVRELMTERVGPGARAEHHARARGDRARHHQRPLAEALPDACRAGPRRPRSRAPTRARCWRRAASARNTSACSPRA